MAQRAQSRLRLSQMWPRSVFRQLVTTISFSWRRMWRTPVGKPDPVWTRELICLVLAGAAVVLLLFPFDALVIDFMRSNRGPLMSFLAEASQVGKSEWYLVPAFTIYLASATADWKGNGYRLKSRLIVAFSQAAFMFVAVAISGIAVNLMKIVFGRARPWMFVELGAYHFDPFVVNKYFSGFPSGHSTTMGAVTAVLMIWCPRCWLPIGIAGLAFSAFRVPAAAHYPSDVAAGFLFGFVVAVVMARFIARRRTVFYLCPGKTLPTVTGISQRIRTRARY